MPIKEDALFFKADYFGQLRQLDGVTRLLPKSSLEEQASCGWYRCVYERRTKLEERNFLETSEGYFCSTFVPLIMPRLTSDVLRISSIGTISYSYKTVYFFFKNDGVWKENPDVL